MEWSLGTHRGCLLPVRKGFLSEEPGVGLASGTGMPPNPSSSLPRGIQQLLVEWILSSLFFLHPLLPQLSSLPPPFLFGKEAWKKKA